MRDNALIACATRAQEEALKSLDIIFNISAAHQPFYVLICIYAAHYFYLLLLCLFSSLYLNINKYIYIYTQMSKSVFMVHNKTENLSYNKTENLFSLSRISK